MCDMSCDVTCDRDRDVTFDVTLSRIMSHSVTEFPTLWIEKKSKEKEKNNDKILGERSGLWQYGVGLQLISGVGGCHKLHSDISPWIMGLFQWSKLHWKALKKTFPMMLGSPQHLKNLPRDQPINSHWTLNCLYLRNRWLWAFAFDCITKLSSRQSHRS